MGPKALRNAFGFGRGRTGGGALGVHSNQIQKLPVALMNQTQLNKWGQRVQQQWYHTLMDFGEALDFAGAR